MGFWGTNRSLTERKGKRGLMRRSRLSGNQRRLAAKEDDGGAVLEQPKRAWGDGLREQRSWGYRGDKGDISVTCWGGEQGGRVQIFFRGEKSLEEKLKKERRKKRREISGGGFSSGKGSRGRRGIWAEGKPFDTRLRTQVWRWWAFLLYIIWFSSLHIVDLRQGLMVFVMIFILLFSFSVFSVFPQMTET